MNQPTFEDGPQVPLMVEGHIDAATLRQMFSDLIAHAKNIQVQEKQGATSLSAEGSADVPAQFDRFLNDGGRCLQIRYGFDGHAWIDTVFRTREGFRVVRCRSEPAIS